MSEKNVKPKTKESEIEIFTNYINNPSIDVRNEIVGKYMYLAEIITRKFLNRGIEYDDIFQIAGIALIKAVERFDISIGFKFSTFATPTIIGEIKRFFRDKGSTIRVPRRIYETFQKVSKAKEELTQQLNRSPRVQEIAKYINMTEEEVVETLEAENVYNIQSFDKNLYDNDNDMYETVGKNDNTFDKIDNVEFLKKALDKFNNAEKQFVKYRYFDKQTQKQIASKLGVSQMYVSRLEKKILEKFRTILKK